MLTKPKYFVANIGKKGRVLRGLTALVLLISGIGALQFSLILGFVLFASSAFVLFEALRGWCAFRACGIKTKF